MSASSTVSAYYMYLVGALYIDFVVCVSYFWVIQYCSRWRTVSVVSGKLGSDGVDNPDTLVSGFHWFNLERTKLAVSQMNCCFFKTLSWFDISAALEARSNCCKNHIHCIVWLSQHRMLYRSWPIAIQYSADILNSYA